MRRVATLVALATLWTNGGDVLAAGNKVAAREAELTTMIDKLAKDVFAQADKNHNHFLSKTEFSRAAEMLTAEADQWGQNG